MITIGYLFGCLAAAANASANVMQRSVNRQESDELQFSLRLIANLVRRPVWLASIAMMLSSFVLQAAGLGLATLAAIELLIVLELPLTLIGARLFLGGRLGRPEWSAVAAMTAGTIGLIAVLNPAGGRVTGIGWLTWLIAIVATAVPVAVSYTLGRLARSAGRRAATLGVGAGLSFGLAAALIKGMTGQFAVAGVAGAIASWQLYGAGVAGVLGFWMDQNATNAGRLAAAQPGITLADPCVSIAWGALVFHETMRRGWWLAGAVAAAVVMSAGALALARSPLTTGDQAAREDSPAIGPGARLDRGAREAGKE